LHNPEAGQLDGGQLTKAAIIEKGNDTANNNSGNPPE